MKELCDKMRESDAVALRHLRAYVTSVSSDAKLTLKSKVQSLEASDIRYVTRPAVIDLYYLNEAKLPRQIAPLIKEAKTQTKAAIN